MPGYEPFLLCDFHVHTRWSDGRLTLREVVDLYGETGKFDVIAITDHILMKKDLLARMAASRRSASETSPCPRTASPTTSTTFGQRPGAHNASTACS